MSAEPEFIAETLAWCNERRAEKGMDALERLPKGHRYSPRSCPCGKATGLYVRYLTYGNSQDDEVTRGLPRPVTSFARAFDDGELPQYDEELA